MVRISDCWKDWSGSFVERISDCFHCVCLLEGVVPRALQFLCGIPVIWYYRYGIGMIFCHTEFRYTEIFDMVLV
ncbi:hypothetical protein ACS0TY_036668 [Phlomoides rotata]